MLDAVLGCSPARSGDSCGAACSEDASLRARSVESPSTVRPLSALLAGSPAAALATSPRDARALLESAVPDTSDDEDRTPPQLRLGKRARSAGDNGSPRRSRSASEDRSPPRLQRSAAAPACSPQRSPITLLPRSPTAAPRSPLSVILPRLDMAHIAACAETARALVDRVLRGSCAAAASGEALPPEELSAAIHRWQRSAAAGALPPPDPPPARDAGIALQRHRSGSGLLPARAGSAPYVPPRAATATECALELPGSPEFGGVEASAPPLPAPPRRERTLSEALQQV